jgi:hypothetical protein
MTAAEAVAEFVGAESREGWEVIIPRRIATNEIHRVRSLPQVVGWRYDPGAKGKPPYCTCKYCTRGNYGAARLRARLDAPDGSLGSGGPAPRAADPGREAHGARCSRARRGSSHAIQAIPRRPLGIGGRGARRPVAVACQACLDSWTCRSSADRGNRNRESRQECPSQDGISRKRMLAEYESGRRHHHHLRPEDL